MLESIAGVIGLRRPGSRVEDMLLNEFRPTVGPSSVWVQEPTQAIALGRRGGTAIGPSIDPSTGCVCVGSIRLDNRDRIRERLGPQVAAGGHGDASDQTLALGAYLRWKQDFAQHLLGDFALAIWDPRIGQLTLCRDQLGARTIVYAPHADGIVFASAVAPVLDISPRTHRARIERLQHMMVEPLEAIDVTSTGFEGIERVPAGSSVTWSEARSTQVQPPYFRVEAPPPLRLADDAMYRDALFEVLDLAVGDRLHHHPHLPGPAAMLSGGLDSSMIVARAAAMVGGPMRTYSAVETNPDEGSDTPFVEAMLEAFDLDPVLIGESELADLCSVESLLRDPDGFFDADMPVLAATARLMAQTPRSVLLTGIGGDTLFGATLSGRRSPLRRVAPRVVRMPVRGWRADRALSVRLDEVGIAPGSTAGRRLRRDYRHFANDLRWTTSNRRLNLIRRPFSTVALERYERSAARFGIEVRHPFYDLRVIEFALSLPLEQLLRQPWSKWLLRASGVLPSTVAWRPKHHGAMGQLWHAAMANQWPPGQRFPHSPHPELFSPQSANSADAGTLGQWNRFVAAMWWHNHGQIHQAP